MVDGGLTAKFRPSKGSGHRVSNHKRDSRWSRRGFHVTTGTTMPQMTKWVIAVNPSLVLMGALQGSFAIAVASSFATLQPLRVALTLVLTPLEAVGVRFINDYDDFTKGIDTVETVRPNSALALGLNMQLVRRIGVTSVAAMIVISSYLIATVNPWVLLIVPLPFLILFLYSGGPHPLGHSAMGEVIDFIFNGSLPVIVGIWVNAKGLNSSAVIAGISVGFLYATLMLHNNARDIVKDAAQGKKTLPQMISQEATKLVYIGFLVLAYALTVLAALVAHKWSAVAPVATLPWAVILLFRVKRSTLGDSLFSWAHVYLSLIHI